jgi:hypothetical protein
VIREPVVVHGGAVVFDFEPDVRAGEVGVREPEAVELASNMGVWDAPERLNRRRMAMGLFQSKERKQAKGTSCAGLRSQSLRRSS